MINQEFKAKGTKYQVLPNFKICCRELGGSKQRVFAHACAVCTLSIWHKTDHVTFMFYDLLKKKSIKNGKITFKCF